MHQEREALDGLYRKYIVSGNHDESDYFGIIKELVARRNASAAGGPEHALWQREIDRVYELVRAELVENQDLPRNPVKFGTSGWRGIIGKDIFVKSICQVTLAIIGLYEDLAKEPALAAALGVASLDEARRRGVVVGHDNRFGGDLLARSVTDVLTSHGFTVHFAGEASTGTLSAAVLELEAAFSVNLTPSHNPLEYAGFKFNAADAGPAAPEVTDAITANTRRIMETDEPVSLRPDHDLVRPFNAIDAWISLVRRNHGRHGLDFDAVIKSFKQRDDIVLAVDCVHGASRVHINALLGHAATDRLLLFRANADPTFGGIAPEPSTENMRTVSSALSKRPEPLKLGVIMDPDADRVRFTDGVTEISMNHFGGIAYYYLHEVKGKQGMVAKTVATSNFANAIARAFSEEVFEPRVGFKEFKPVIDRALVCFEESDGITVIGHTPEKDAYIGLLLALDMVLNLKKNLGDMLAGLQEKYGFYYPARDGIAVGKQGAELIKTLARLEKYDRGSRISVGGEQKEIVEIIDIDGRKMILDDGSWLMVRPSGTEPKVRFYVEARTEAGKDALFAAAKNMLAEIGLL